MQDILCFANDLQLIYLGSQKIWFVDATFHVVGKPFMQLFTIRVILYNDFTIQTIPLFHV